ncbi:hypothetical protein QJV43_gp23 [Serratia phage Serbin]|uniref:Uncharacterized protein n=2 Tax=Serbinvirus TaxID=3153074 RepID=A0A482MH51_9CAUD|nr:hypothetical protein QJV43_gp23 [Serratia phage Serbin]YP_010774529.1 hypothetical protein QJV46_gp23 [Serratia phage vB_SmaS_Opt-155]QBQ72939.1 hypothetical protein CPT_Serbin_023 [Serratia phage Serbin]UGO52730.1 hypothetical protein OPT155_23 [Serratia phage vB_SmaS_Opt-155]
MISAPLSMTVAEAMSLPNVIVALAVEIAFDSGITRVHTGVGQIMIGGQVFDGVGSIGNVSSVTEENSTSPTSVQLTLTGLNNELLSITLNEKVVGKEVICYIAVFDTTYTEIASNVIYRGKITQTAVVAGDEGALTYTVSNIFQEWSKGKPWRYTDESQKQLNQGDRIFRYVGQMSERSIYWGSKKDAPGFTYE